MSDWETHTGQADNQLSQELLNNKIKEYFERAAGQKMIELDPHRTPADAHLIWNLYLPKKEGSFLHMTPARWLTSSSSSKIGSTM